MCVGVWNVRVLTTVASSFVLRSRITTSHIQTENRFNCYHGILFVSKGRLVEDERRWWRLWWRFIRGYRLRPYRIRLKCGHKSLYLVTRRDRISQNRNFIWIDGCEVTFGFSQHHIAAGVTITRRIRARGIIAFNIIYYPRGIPSRGRTYYYVEVVCFIFAQLCREHSISNMGCYWKELHFILSEVGR